ncbi:hypothetical protein FHG87_022618 [Trinorchestia longiramus]|nr:hypothetical protein FHG87_022618 [Trinorchestia longiramus]
MDPCAPRSPTAPWSPQHHMVPPAPHGPPCTPWSPLHPMEPPAPHGVPRLPGAPSAPLHHCHHRRLCQYAPSVKLSLCSAEETFNHREFLVKEKSNKSELQPRSAQSRLLFQVVEPHGCGSGHVCFDLITSNAEHFCGCKLCEA